MIRRSPLKRSQKPIARSAIKKRPRKKSEFARIYGSKERMLFVKSLPCAACGVVGYSENAHLLGNGGMSRKADYTTIGPLCADMIASFGCHSLYDKYGWVFEKRIPDFDAARVAADTEVAWLRHLEAQHG